MLDQEQNIVESTICNNGNRKWSFGKKNVVI